MSDFSDALLLKRYCAGDRAAFDTIYRRYAARMHATAYRLTANWEDAEDVLQEAFVRLSRSAAGIRRRASLSTWLYRTTTNLALDVLRRRRGAAISLDASSAVRARIIAVESLRRERQQRDSAQKFALLRQVEAQLPCLPERQAAVFVLRGFQGLQHRDIGEILGISEATSKSHYSLACRKLREWVDKQQQAQTPPQKQLNQNR